MVPNSLDSNFEEYRKARQLRRSRSGKAMRPMGENKQVLQELELAEAKELQDQQLTREVHDFFTDATRQAANIVQRVSETQEHVVEDRLRSEMAEFLQSTIERAQEFVRVISATANSQLAAEEVEANMQNLVGAALDQFRAEGTAQLSDRHFGEDPFDQELAQTEVQPDPEVAPQSGNGDEVELEGHLVAEVHPLPEEETQQVEATAAAESAAQTAADDSMSSWFERLSDEPEKLRDSLRVLVRNGLMSKDEALVIYRRKLGGQGGQPRAE